MPQLPHPCVSLAPGAHMPSPAHAVQSLHWHASVQMRFWVPQSPHDCMSDVPGKHVPGSTPQSRHVPSTQNPPPGQGVPGQQASPGLPHALHVSPPQLKPVVHASPAQQGSPSRPHAEQTSSRHTRMPSHEGLASQQAPPSNPHPASASKREVPSTGTSVVASTPGTSGTAPSVRPVGIIPSPVAQAATMHSVATDALNTARTPVDRPTTRDRRACCRRSCCIAMSRCPRGRSAPGRWDTWEAAAERNDAGSRRCSHTG